MLHLAHVMPDLRHGMLNLLDLPQLTHDIIELLDRPVMLDLDLPDLTHVMLDLIDVIPDLPLVY